MKDRIDHILLGLLWLLAATLGTSFWFNTNYGFNIFSGPHWEYLAYLQASRTPVRVGFYISLAVAIFIAILGLYLLIRPRFKKIKFPWAHQRNKKNQVALAKTQTISKSNNNPPIADTTASTVEIMPAEIPPQPTPAPMPTSARPPRLVLPTMNNSHISAPPAPVLAETIAPLGTPVPSQNQPEIREIFTQAGYTVKKSPKLSGVQTALLAIGTNETLWMGAVGIKTTDLRRAMDNLSQVFSDTLDDIFIGINGFVIAAPDATTSEFQDILMFNSIADLREYMAQHPNPPLASDDHENFAAYSQYIDTVINYVDKT